MPRDRPSPPRSPLLAHLLLAQLTESTLESHSRDSLMSVSFVYENTCDAPSGDRRWLLVVGALVLQFERLGWTVLTPSLCVTIVIDHECGVCSARLDELSLERLWITNSSLVLDVVRSAPASSVDSVVALDQLCESVPGRLVQGPDGELRCSRRAFRCHGWMLRNSKPSRRALKCGSRPLRREMASRPRFVSSFRLHVSGLDIRGSQRLEHRGETSLSQVTRIGAPESR